MEWLHFGLFLLVKIVKNATNLRKNNIIYKALKYYLEILNQKNASPTSHGEGSWGKGLTTTINELNY
jgi:hypothetical protein